MEAKDFKQNPSDKSFALIIRTRVRYKVQTTVTTKKTNDKARRTKIN
jgi:hypothetical protein